MSSSSPEDELGRVLVDFSEKGIYPQNEETAASHVESLVLPAALSILQNAKADLESEIKQISRESAPDVDNWIAHAKTIQNDIQEAQKLASSITRKAQAEEQRLETLEEQQKYAQFLTKEVAFQDQLLQSLNAIQSVHQLLNEAEDLATRSQVTEALHRLNIARDALNCIPMEKSTRAMRLLSSKCAELEQFIHKQFSSMWMLLVAVDQSKNTLTIQQKIPDLDTDISHALQGLEAFQETHEAARKLWADIDTMIIRPRTLMSHANIPAVQIGENSVFLDGTTDRTIKSLCSDVERVIEFLDSHLPSDFVQDLASFMMPPMSRYILDDWLYTAVPASLDDMVDYQKTLALVHDFACKLDLLRWPGSEAFHDWVSSAPRIWLNKCRETALDWTRNQISLGIGNPIVAERVEKQMVARQEVEDLVAATAGNEVTQEWDSAWDSETGSDAGPPINDPSPTGERNRRSLEEERQASEINTPDLAPISQGDDEDDGADAWGWGDDEDAEPEPEQESEPELPVESVKPAQVPHSQPSLPAATREMTLSEKYWISSMPQPVFNSIKKLYNDAAILTQPESEKVPITAAAPGLFNLPTLVLAMYRAVSPSYYTTHPGGNMFLYNDSMWLAENFRSFLDEWNSRTDLSPRAYGMVKLEPEIKVLTSFGKRAYTSELIEQRTIISDLFGGTQNFFQQDVPPGKHSLDDRIDPVIQHVRSQAVTWKNILPYSAWASATGALVNSIAMRIITDVFEIPDISVDEAERIATIISLVETFDELFIPQNSSNEIDKQVPTTPRFADKWMKMKFLSEVLQSNLADVKFLWFESDLSLYFTVDEVIELIGLSFEKNQAVRAAVKEIKERPTPKIG